MNQVAPAIGLALGQALGQALTDRGAGRPAAAFPAFPTLPGSPAGAMSGGPVPALGFGGPLSFTWIGQTRDEVGSGATPGPSGGPDGTFALDTSSLRTGIRSIDIFGLNESGAQNGNRWSTANSSYWILGVSTAGGRANPGGYASSLSLQPQPLYLFVQDPGGAFSPGQRYGVELILADGSRVSGGAVVGGGGSIGLPAPAGGPVPASGFGGGALSFTWIGQTRDEVGAGATPGPSGGPDGTFALDAPAARSPIRAIEVIGLGVSGSPNGHRWSSANGSYWILGVLTAGGRANPGGHASSLSLQPQPLQLYIQDPGGGAFGSGQRFRVEVELVDGARLSTEAAIN